MTPIISVLSMPFINSAQTAKDFQSSEEKDSRDKLFSDSEFTFKILILSVLVLIPSVIFAQRKSDIGFFGGTSFYMGDINTSRYFYSPGVVFGPIYRYNFEPRNSIRLHAFFYTLHADDRDFSDPTNTLRDASFSGNFVDAAAIYEFNFVPYKTTHRKYNRTFYLSGGIGYNFEISSDVPSGNYFTIPFGLGYKLNVTKKLAAGVELSIRKTFTDLIDGVENIYIEGDKRLFGNNDWYTFAGFFITYKIFNFREDCPAYDQ
jgi:hypothetical protein